MDIENLTKWVFPFVSTISIVIVTILYSFSKFREMKDDASQELISILKEEAVVQKSKAERLQQENQKQRDDFQRQITELKEGHQKQINDIRVEMANLKALYEASERSKAEYLEILQGKSPDQQKYQEDMRNFTKGVAKYMENSAVILSKLNDKLIKSEARDYRVDNGPTHKRDKSIVNIEKMTLESQERDKKIDKGGE